MAMGLGIDIGSESVKAVQVKVSGGKIVVTGAMKIPRSSAPKATEGDQDPSGLQNIPATLGHDLTAARMRRAGCLGLTGRDIVLRYLTTPPMAQQKLRMFIDLQIADRVIPGKKEEGAQALTYDFRILNVPTGLKGDMVIMAAAAKNDYLSGIMASCGSAGVTARRMTPSAFALAQAYLKTQQIPPKETVAVVDVGHEGMEIAIINEDAIYFARNGPGGSKRFDVSLAKAFSWSGERLRECKHNRIRIYADEEMVRGPEQKQVQDALREGADAIASGIRGAVTFCRTQAKMARLDYRRTILCGGGARLKGLPEYLEAKTQRPVQLMDFSNCLDLRGLDGQSARCFEGEVPDMAVALGLALVDADPECFHLELTPAFVKAKRVFWGRTVYAAAAGVVFLGSLAVPFASAQKSLVVAEQKRDELTKMVTRAEKLKKDFQARVEENQKLALKREYYARQARMGPVYLSLWDQLRVHAPKGLMFLQLAAQSQNVEITSLKEPVREWVVQGYYDPNDLPQFEETLQKFFEKLKGISGMDRVPELNAAFDDSTLKKPSGTRGFEFKIALASSFKPILAPQPPASAPAAAPAPAVPSGNGEARKG